MAKDRTAKDKTDPGADTEMFRAFVERSETYQARPASKGPLIVALLALVIAIVAFALIMGTQ